MKETFSGRIMGQSVAIAVAQGYDLTLSQLCSQRRARKLVHARFVAIYAMRELCPHLSTPMIGKLLGGRDHSTIVYGNKRAKSLVMADPHASVLRAIYADLGEGAIDAQLKLAKSHLYSLQRIKKKLQAKSEAQPQQVAA